MKNKYISEIFKEYDHLQEKAKSEQGKRQEEIYSKFKRVKEIDEEISKIGFELASLIFKGIDADRLITESRKKITDLKMEKAEILVENGYPVDYLEIKYKCSKCKDTGYVGNEKCSCFKQKLIDSLYKQSNLKDILRYENFDTFDFSLYSREKDSEHDISPQENMQQIYAKCISFYKNFDFSYENLFFFGKSGLGKTFLSNCIAKELLDMGKVVIYQTAAELIETLRRARFDENTPSDIIEELFDCDLLIIDDLGTEQNTSFAQTELFNVINNRLLKKKKMIISTNIPIESFNQCYPDRLTSRIFGLFTVFEFFGDDIRIMKNINRKR
ncbi:DNA replication protein DnaC [Caloramator quimbayensis]|uniref:DNA replication protein DnaC n=1 Tax=Caloramator quimbayensis TaxID=1147123 RepID=A0A1T4Y685_9CLOT|nr:ATP-binding protein [Caloramator quimbayensis]SKA97028.1 DNA replication protein DnaC [Caloramator quimbayensis]